MGELDLTLQDLVLAVDAEPTAKFTGPTGIPTQGEPVDTDRRRQFQRLDRQIHAVGNVRLDNIDAVGIDPGPAAACDQLTDDKTPPFRVSATELKNQHFAGGIRRHLLRQNLLEGADHASGDALDGRCPGIDRRRLGGIDDGPDREFHMNRPETSAICRNIGSGQSTHGEACCRQGSGGHAVKRAVDLLAGLVEIECDFAIVDDRRDRNPDSLVDVDAVVVQVIRVSVFAGWNSAERIARHDL